VNISNSSVGKYRTNPNNTKLLTFASVNIFAKNEFEEEIFNVIFFLFILYYYLSFLDEKKKHYTTSLYLTIVGHKRKKYKSKCEGATNKSTNIPNFFLEFSDIEKELVWPNIKLKWA